MEVRLDDIIVTKSGDSNGGTNCSLYGQNAALLVKDGAIATIQDARIISTAKGGNGLFSYGGSSKGKGDGTRIDISDSTITTNGIDSGGLSTTGGGQINASSLTVNTSGSTSSPITSNLGGGKLVVNEGTYSSSGVDSPAVYCMAEMTLNQCSLVSSASSGIVLRGSNSITLNDCSIDANDTYLTYPCMCKSGILIYDTELTDKSATLNMSGGSITNLQGHVIHVTNTSANIVLNDVLINNMDTEAILLSVSNDGWSGSPNVAIVDFQNMKVHGNILVDNSPTSQGTETSKLDISLSSNSIFTGSINASLADENRGEVNLTVKKGCKFILSETSYITSLSGSGKIVCGDYDLYVNGEKYEDKTDPDADASELILNEHKYKVVDYFGKLIVKQNSLNKSITASIKKSGQFIISGYGVDTTVRVENTATDVTLIIDNLIIDNSKYKQHTSNDSCVLMFDEGTNVKVEIRGSCQLTGSDSFRYFPKSIIRAASSNVTFDGDGTLRLMNRISGDIKFKDDEYPDGIWANNSKLTFNSGKIISYVDGSSIKTNNTSINFINAEFNVEYSGNDSIVCDEGIININGGRLDISESRGYGITCNCAESTNKGSIIISGGFVRIYKIEECGIRCENLTITDGELEITCIYHKSADSFYTTGRDVIEMNTIFPISDVEYMMRVNVDCGYHHGIEIGKQGKTYRYLQVLEEDSSKEVRHVYSQSRSGSLNISGGTIHIDTQITGVATRALLTEGYKPCSNGVYVVGSPGDGILSYGSVNISGGELDINAGGNGIECDGSISISDTATVNINEAFVGILGATILLGKKDDNDNPNININSSGDNIVTISRSYDYEYKTSANEDCDYTLNVIYKTFYSDLYMYSGNFITDIETRKTKSVTLRSGTPDSYVRKTINYQSLGNSVKCFGCFYVEGGNIEIYGPYTYNLGYQPINVTSQFMVNDQAILLVTGVDNDDKSLPNAGNCLFISPNEINYDNETEFKVYESSDEFIYGNMLKNGGSFVLLAHPQFRSRAYYKVKIGDEIYQVPSKDAFKM